MLTLTLEDVGNLMTKRKYPLFFHQSVDGLKLFYKFPAKRKMNLFQNENQKVGINGENTGIEPR